MDASSAFCFSYVLKRICLGLAFECDPDLFVADKSSEFAKAWHSAWETQSLKKNGNFSNTLPWCQDFQKDAVEVQLRNEVFVDKEGYTTGRHHDIPPLQFVDLTEHSNVDLYYL
jgi:hypothetical protein